MIELTPSSEIATSSEHAVSVVVFGRDAQGKSHASRFSAAEASQAERAAGLMGMRVLRLFSDEEIAIGEGIARGKLYENSGRAFVPYVTAQRFALLEAAPGVITPERPGDVINRPVAPKQAKGRRMASGEANPAEGSTKAASDAPEGNGDPAVVGVGSLVLACEADAPETWWLARIISDRDPEFFELRWGGEWQDEPSFTRERDHVAILPPAFAEKLEQNKS